MLSHYERGIRECGLDFLCKAADFYGVSTDYLLGRSADRNGAQLTVDDIPEFDTNSTDKKFKGSTIPVLNKKLIVNSLIVLFDLLQRVDCRALTTEISGYLMLSVYKVFRLVYQSNPKNSRSFFSVPDNMCRGMSTAAMEIAESRITALSSGKAVDELIGIEDTTLLELSDELLLQQYPHLVTSLLNLIRTAEGRAALK